MCIIYGKCEKTEDIKSAYDYQPSGSKIMPIAELMPLIESMSEDKQKEILKGMMSLFDD
jgi:hypothetical protein